MTAAPHVLYSVPGYPGLVIIDNARARGDKPVTEGWLWRL